jgi:glycosyltransferase involved in cell wall biosynthesis
MKEFQLWSFLPTAVNYVGHLGESLVVYYVTDEYSQFSAVDRDKIAAMDREMCRRADLVFATATSLVEARRGLNPDTFLASHGVDHAHFARALAPEVEVAPEIAALPRPVLGFFGLIHDWIDIELLAHVARQRPDWSVVLIGKPQVDLSALGRLANVHLLGRRPYQELPRYCKGFSVGIIPFVVNELTRHVNPIKLREYLSAGLPVVSTPLPECASHPGLCEVASSPAGFLAAVERAVAADSPAQRVQRSAAMRDESWEARVQAIGRRVVEVRQRRRRPVNHH